MEIRAVELIWLAVLILAYSSKKPRHSLQVLVNVAELQYIINASKYTYTMSLFGLWLCVGFVTYTRYVANF